MKKSVKWIIAVLLVAVAAMAVTYRAVNRVPSEDLSANARVLQIFEDGGCLSCHSASPELPFYAEFPVMGNVVKADSDSGYRAFDIEPLMKSLAEDGAIGETELAKVEKVVTDRRMPMFKYYIVHWGSSITKAKRDIVLGWAKDVRASLYSEALAESRANEPVRPVDLVLDTDPAKVALGEKLFHDPRLSSDNTVSCASCHELTT